MIFFKEIKNYFYRFFIFINNKSIPQNISIFSNDCWGGEAYQLLNRAYASPFIGTYLMSPCYLKLLQNPKHYLNQEIKFIDTSKYQDVEKVRSEFRFRFPVGVLDDIEIQFMHYETKEEAISKWYRRVERINWNAIYIKYDISKDLAKSEDLAIIENLPFKNKLVLGKYQINTTSQIYLKIHTWELDGAKMFNKSIKIFDIYSFINGKGIKQTFRSKCIDFFID